MEFTLTLEFTFSSQPDTAAAQHGFDVIFQNGFVFDISCFLNLINTHESHYRKILTFLSASL